MARRKSHHEVLDLYRAFMTEVSNQNFGLLIAYLIPGAIVVFGIADRVEVVRAWLLSPTPSIGGFLYSTVAAVAAGMLVSTIRWLILDTLHFRTGIPRLAWNLAALPRSLPAFNALVEFHYRYYQANANALVALLLVIIVRIAPAPTPFIQAGIVLALMAVLFAASRDTLRKYAFRTNSLLAYSSKENSMTNGCHREDIPLPNTHVNGEEKRATHQPLPSKPPVSDILTQASGSRVNDIVPTDEKDTGRPN